MATNFHSIALQRIVAMMENLMSDPLGTLYNDSMPRICEENGNNRRVSSDRKGRGVAGGSERSAGDKHSYAVEKAILRVGSLLQLGMPKEPFNSPEIFKIA